jgi:hypothetical protein
VALFNASARKPDGSPVIAYYDRQRGNLKYTEWDPTQNQFTAPVILDGELPDGTDTGDVGQYPSVAVEGDGTAHISYEDATQDNLLYINTRDKTPEIADDGYRPDDETTLDGLPAPVYHLVGDSSSIQLAPAGFILIAYQDSTVEQLRLVQRDPMSGMWSCAGPNGWGACTDSKNAIAGHATPFAGSYGFYAQVRVSGGTAVLSSYAINQHKDTPEVYVEIFGVSLGTIM